MEQRQLELPLDERFRQAEQYSLELEQPPPKRERQAEMQVCIGNCNICRYCDNSNNRN